MPRRSRGLPATGPPAAQGCHTTHGATLAMVATCHTREGLSNGCLPPTSPSGQRRAAPLFAVKAGGPALSGAT